MKEEIFSPQDKGEDITYSQLVHHAIDYIEKNIDSRVYLSEIAKLIKTSESYLSSLFKKETGKTMTTYINALKVDRAKTLFRDGLLVYEVSRRLGFENSHYFSKVFKKYAGVTPQNYRLKYSEAGVFENMAYRADERIIIEG